MWEGGAFLGALTPKFYVALTGTSSLISGLILIFEWWYFRKYGTSFIEQVSLAQLAPWLAPAEPAVAPAPSPAPAPDRSPPHHPPGSECKVWRNPTALLRGAEYGRLWSAAPPPAPRRAAPPLTYYDMNLSAQDHQAWFSCSAGEGAAAAGGASGAEEAMCRAWREREPAARVAAARQALALSADCAPALLLLAEEEAPTVLEAERVLRRAWRAAELAVRAGPSRRAAAVLAHVKRRAAMCARRLGRLREAARLFRELAREAPGALGALALHENLLEVLLEQRAYADAQGVVARCEDAALPPSAALLYTAALLRARAAAPAAAAAPPRAAAELAALDAMRRAIEFNPYVPAYLLEQRALSLPPEHVVRRGRSEALAYAFWHLRHWRAASAEPALRLLQAAAAARPAWPREPACTRCADRELLPPRTARAPRRALPAAAALLFALLAALLCALLAHRWPEPRALLRLLALV